MQHTDISAYWEKAMTYEAYLSLTIDLMEKGQTTGPNQTEDLAHYTRLNSKRMQRLGKTIRLSTDWNTYLTGFSSRYKWLVLTESWCGDAAQVLPVLAILAQAVPDQIALRVILRDENLDLMDQFQTQGTRSIPKLIAMDADTLQVKGSWGPRPAGAQVLVDAYKANPDRPFAEFAGELQQWYNKDKSTEIQQELLSALKRWEQA